MEEIKKKSLTKKDISKKINFKTGLSNLYSKQITDDFVEILKSAFRRVFSSEETSDICFLIFLRLKKSFFWLAVVPSLTWDQLLKTNS